jgi:hypothetical protein
MNANKKVSKVRMLASVMLGAIGMSLVAALVPATASAEPYDPHSGPLHPVRHYAGDIEHPAWALHHPLRALIP